MLACCPVHDCSQPPAVVLNLCDGLCPGVFSRSADALVELIVQAGAVDAVVPLLSIAEKADPAVAAR